VPVKPGYTTSQFLAQVVLPNLLAAAMVILTHGWMRNNDQMVGWARHLASWGFEVVAPNLCHATVFDTDHEANARDLTALVQDRLQADPVVLIVVGLTRFALIPKPICPLNPLIALGPLTSVSFTVSTDTVVAAGSHRLPPNQAGTRTSSRFCAVILPVNRRVPAPVTTVEPKPSLVPPGDSNTRFATVSLNPRVLKYTPPRRVTVAVSAI
jgi:hypothetical protein